MKKILLLLLLSVLFVGVEVQAAPSLTSGVAPLAVHFFADFVDSASDDERIDRFHHYDYTWDFGDTGSGNWGTTGKSKNIAKGPVATHIFETSGTYTVNLTVKNGTTVVNTGSFTITVQDPDTVYSGTKTTCVNNASDSDFTGAPSGSRHVSTDDLSTITQYATVGSRVLFKRGGIWTTSDLSWPDNAGPITIGAYGTGSNPTAQGIYANAPQITVTNGNFLTMDNKQNWRIMDLRINGNNYVAGGCGGTYNMQRILIQRMWVEHTNGATGWSHWNTSALMTIDQMLISDCFLDGANGIVVYAGGERIALLGNIIRNSNTTHVCRIWQAYLGVISHNIISGSSLTNDTGRHALKLHGPGYSYFGNETELGTPVPNTSLLEHRTELAVVSDNVFGSSGPWPVMISPQDSYTDSLLTDIIFERNRIITNYGTKSSLSSDVQVAMHITGRYITARNNIFDGTGSSNDYTAIDILNEGYEPTPLGVEVYNNTIYRSDNTSGNLRTGISVGGSASKTIIKNNLLSFPNSSVPTNAIVNSSSDLIAESNLLTNTPGFIDPNNSNPLLTNFNVQPGSPAINQGTSVPVYEDINNDIRPNGSYDLGAYEYGAFCPNKAVHISETSNYYDTVSAAYSAASTGQTILMQEKSFTENLSLTDDITVTLRGGYDCNYSANPGFTTISGIVTIGGLASVIADKIIIK